MFKLLAYFVFHLSQRCMLFYGQLEPRDLSEATFAKLFEDAEKLLIGQSKLVTIDGEQFVCLNHEDIISCAFVSDVTKQDEKDAIILITKLGKAFKRQFQAEIDEFDPTACDLGGTFGGFSSVLASALNDILLPKESGGSDAKEDAIGDKANEAPVHGTAAGAVGSRFPGGFLAPEERDEILFREYEDLTALYNVEMVDGIVSKNKIFIYANIGDYHEITIDYSSFPALPKILMPPALSNILAVSRTVQGWNPENPARVVDVIAEIEQLVGSMHPAGLTSAEKEAEINGYMEGIGFDAAPGKAVVGHSPDARKAASSVLASRLLTKDKKGSQEGAGALDVFTPEPLPTYVNQIIDEKKHPEHKTSLRDMVARQKAAGAEVRSGQDEGQTLQPENEIPAPAPVSTPAPSVKPQKFVIRPRFVVEGEEIPLGKVEDEPAQNPPAQRKQDLPPPRLAPTGDGITITPRQRPTQPDQPERVPVTKPNPKAIDPDEMDRGIDIVGRHRPAMQPKQFAIPDVTDLDNFVPATPVKRPEIKEAPVPMQRPVPAPPAKSALKPSSPAAPVAKSRPVPKKKDDEDMFGWGDDGGEMEVKQSKVEIKDFDGPIKKVKEG